MPQSPLATASDIISCSILVNGEKIQDTYILKKLEVRKQINHIPSAKLTFIDGDAAEETFAISETETFTPGNEIEITAGYEGQDKTIFKGIIVKHGIQIRSEGHSYLLVSCFDQAVKLTIGRKSNLFLKQKDSGIIEKIIAEAGLKGEVAASEIEHEEIVRYYATDWDFIVARSEINGFIVLVDDGKVSIKPPDIAAEAGLSIRLGDSIQEMSAEIDARTQWPSVKCAAWDISAQNLASGESKEPEVNPQGNLSGKELAKALGLPPFELQTPASLLKEGLSGWANAQLLKSRLARLRGTVSFQGNATPKPGTLVELAGLGARFNGNAFVSSVSHRIEDGDWLTEVGFGLSARWFVDEHRDIEAPLASGLLPGVHGLHIGKVKRIDEDPNGQTRILVDAPLINTNGAEGLWARLATGYATQNAGFFFMPEVGDEVVLGFLNDDPRFPLILDSLYSSAQTPPYTPDKDNKNKAIVSKNQVKISIDDDKKILKIETPGGQVVTLDDDAKSLTLQDSNGNKVELTSSGIALNSGTDISLKASGNIKIEASQGVTLKAATALNLEGLNVNAKASVAFKAEGQASAELSASGQTTVKGAMVMIN
ncbi:MAG: type VI secretion system tip protein VgrG [Methylococcaceae bacterium]|nr:type VI secretion system tip protein VgrG [Methylococcaceae bacterium]